MGEKGDPGDPGEDGRNVSLSPEPCPAALNRHCPAPVAPSSAPGPPVVLRWPPKPPDTAAYPGDLAPGFLQGAPGPAGPKGDRGEPVSSLPLAAQEGR